MVYKIDDDHFQTKRSYRNLAKCTVLSHRHAQKYIAIIYRYSQLQPHAITEMSICDVHLPVQQLLDICKLGHR